MAAPDLITRARAYQNLGALSGVDALIDVLVTAYSRSIEKYCRRDFLSSAYDELYNGDGQRYMLLRQFPLISVQSIRYRPVTVLKVTNTKTNTPISRVSVTSVGLTLIRVTSGVTTTDTSITFAGNVTVIAVQNAVNALGNNWSAQGTGYDQWPSQDIYCPMGLTGASGGTNPVTQGALTTAGQFAELKLHTYELAGYQLDARRGWLLRAIPYTDPELLHPEDLIWPVGINNFRVQYTSGFATVPEDVQEACARWVAYGYFETTRDPSVRNLLTAGGVSTAWGPLAGRLIPHPPDDIQVLLAPYRRRDTTSV